MTCPFDLDHYRELLDAADAGGYRFAFFDHHPSPGTIFLRHDVDLSLEALVELGELEAHLGGLEPVLVDERRDHPRDPRDELVEGTGHAGRPDVRCGHG